MMQTKNQNTNQIQIDEDKRMAMEFLEEDATLDISEVIKYPPVSISCGTYTDIDFNGVRREYPVPIGTDGNFSFVQAHPKVGKSFFVSLLVSAYQGGSNEFTGKLKGHRNGRKIIHFDTEQGKFHCQKVFRRPVIMNGLSEDENYHTYALRAMSYKDRIGFIDYILNSKFKGENVGLVIIDGISDLVSDVNNISESNEVTQQLMTWTTELNCHITTIIHTNFGSDKPTGHLGSFLEKKAETQIKLEKNHINKGCVIVECKRSRNRSFDTFSFTITDKGLPLFVDNDYEF